MHRTGLACAISLAGLLAVANGALGRQGPSGALAETLVTALKPALPFPAAASDGTPADGRAESTWIVRWPDGGVPGVEVLANPLNAGNRARALQVEEAIQKAAMQSQQRSQADYEKALADFQRTGRVSGIREISLTDDGLAGERYDAESQLTIEARVLEGDARLEVATSKTPQAFPGSEGPTTVVRLSANEYAEPADGTAPPLMRFCPEQAWLVFGPAAVAVTARHGEDRASVSVGRTGAQASRVVVVWLRGNVELVDRVLQRANWPLLAARLGG